MALKALLTPAEFEALPEAVRAEYKQTGANYTLDVEGMVPKAKVDEFRENNTALLKTKAELEAQLAKYSGINLEDYEALKETERKIADKTLIEAGRVDELIAIKVAEAVNKAKADSATLAQQLEASNKAEKEARAQVKTMRRNRMIEDQALKSGARPEALEDLITHADRYGWTIDDESGELVALDAKGGKHYSLANAGKPITLEEWVRDVVPAEKPFYFEDSAGGGAGGAKNGFKGRVIRASDQQGLNANLSDIASGKVAVVPD